MIDFVRIHYKDKSEFEPYVMKEENFEKLQTVMEYHTGEINYPYKTVLDTLDVVITKKSGYVKNSLHKLYNYVNEDEECNYNDFQYSKLCETIDYISKIPNITETKLTNLEFGININVDDKAENIIKKFVLMHNYKGYNHNKEYNGKGFLYQFDHSNYLIKIYDKAKQYKRPDNILRFEIKYKRERGFNDLGIYNLKDLKNKQNLRRLFCDLMKRFEEMQIIDLFDDKDIIKKDKELLTQYINPRFWQEDIKGMSGTTKMRYKRTFNSLILKYGLDTTKKNLNTLLKEKFIQLINN